MFNQQGGIAQIGKMSKATTSQTPPSLIDTHIPDKVGGGCGWTGIISLSLALRRTKRRNRRGRKKERKEEDVERASFHNNLSQAVAVAATPFSGAQQGAS